MEHIQVLTSRMSRLLALPANIRLGRKGLTGTNTLAYLQVAKKKSFVRLAQRFSLFFLKPKSKWENPIMRLEL